MFKTSLARLKNYILQYNPYFDAGYDDVYQDETTGIVANDLPVFPADELGNYFYLRLPNNVTFDNSNYYQISDCITGVGLQSAVVLVACMRGADADHLVANLVNTLQAYQADEIKLNSAVYQPEVVILQELSRVKADVKAAALQRLDKDYCIVSISFNFKVRFDFIPLRCFTNPCASC